MKRKSLLLVPLALMALASCSIDLTSIADTKKEDVFVTRLANNNVLDYITYSYSHTETKTEDNKVLFTVTANFDSIDKDYYYIDFKVKFAGVKTIYSIPKDGKATITYTTQSVTNPSEQVLLIARSGLGKYDVQSGEAYKRIQ